MFPTLFVKNPKDSSGWVQNGLVVALISLIVLVPSIEGFTANGGLGFRNGWSALFFWSSSASGIILLGSVIIITVSASCWMVSRLAPKAGKYVLEALLPLAFRFGKSLRFI